MRTTKQRHVKPQAKKTRSSESSDDLVQSREKLLRRLRYGELPSFFSEKILYNEARMFSRWSAIFLLTITTATIADTVVMRDGTLRQGMVISHDKANLQFQ